MNKKEQLKSKLKAALKDVSTGAKIHGFQLQLVERDDVFYYVPIIPADFLDDEPAEEEPEVEESATDTLTEKELRALHLALPHVEEIGEKYGFNVDIIKARDTNYFFPQFPAEGDKLQKKPKAMQTRIHGGSDDCLIIGRKEFNPSSGGVYQGKIVVSYPPNDSVYVHVMFDGGWSFAVSPTNPDAGLPKWWNVERVYGADVAYSETLIVTHPLKEEDWDCINFDWNPE